MKTTIKLIAVVIIIHRGLLCNAQINTPAQWLAYQQKELKECPYIFEGNIIQQKSYYGKYQNGWLCNVVQITKIFRGSPQLKLGSIKVITRDTRGIADGGPGINKGRYIIFGRPSNFAKPYDSITVNSIITNNTLLLGCNDWVDLRGSDYYDGTTHTKVQSEQVDSLIKIQHLLTTLYHPPAQWGWRQVTQYKTLDSLYSFFKANGVEVQEEVGQTDGTKQK